MASVDTSLAQNRKRRNAATSANERLASKKSHTDDSACPSHLQPTPSNISVNSVASHSQIVPRAQNQEAIVENEEQRRESTSDNSENALGNEGESSTSSGEGILKKSLFFLKNQFHISISLKCFIYSL